MFFVSHEKTSWFNTVFILSGKRGVVSEVCKHQKYSTNIVIQCFPKLIFLHFPNIFFLPKFPDSNFSYIFVVTYEICSEGRDLCKVSLEDYIRIKHKITIRNFFVINATVSKSFNHDSTWSSVDLQGCFPESRERVGIVVVKAFIWRSIEKSFAIDFIKYFFNECVQIFFWDLHKVGKWRIVDGSAIFILGVCHDPCSHERQLTVSKLERFTHNGVAESDEIPYLRVSKKFGHRHFKNTKNNKCESITKLKNKNNKIIKTKITLNKSV